MTEETDHPQEAVTQSPFYSFTHDVLVNVIANLFAAAIIYIFGVTVGLLPFERRAILLAAAFLTMGLALLLFVAAKIYGRSSKQKKQDTSFMFFTISVCLAGVAFILVALTPGLLAWWERVEYVLIGLSTLGVSYLGFQLIQLIRRSHDPH